MTTRFRSDLVKDSLLATTFLPGGDGGVQHTIAGPNRTTGARLQYHREIWTTTRELGRGGFGRVDLQESRSGSLRAVKTIPKAHGAVKIDYSRELEAAFKFSHRRYVHCFVEAFGWYEDSDNVYLAMEYLEHGTLQSYMMPPALSERDAQGIARQLVEGLSLLHGNDFVHRDLKPENILVVKPGPDWWVKIGDFGITKRACGTMSGSHTIVGTEGYCAPEVLMGVAAGANDSEPDDGESRASYGSPVDMWALGEVIFRMIARQPAFRNRQELFRFVTHTRSLDMGPIESTGASEPCQSFLAGLLRTDPSSRLKAVEATEHVWLVGGVSPVASIPDIPTPETDSSEISFLSCKDDPNGPVKSSGPGPSTTVTEELWNSPTLVEMAASGIGIGKNGAVVQVESLSSRMASARLETSTIPGNEASSPQASRQPATPSSDDPGRRKEDPEVARPPSLEASQTAGTLRETAQESAFIDESLGETTDQAARQETEDIEPQEQQERDNPGQNFVLLRFQHHDSIHSASISRIAGLDHLVELTRNKLNIREPSFMAIRSPPRIKKHLAHLTDEKWRAFLRSGAPIDLQVETWDVLCNDDVWAGPSLRQKHWRVRVDDRPVTAVSLDRADGPWCEKKGEKLLSRFLSQLPHPLEPIHIVYAEVKGQPTQATIMDDQDLAEVAAHGLDSVCIHVETETYRRCNGWIRPVPLGSGFRKQSQHLGSRSPLYILVGWQITVSRKWPGTFADLCRLIEMYSYAKPGVCRAGESLFYRDDEAESCAPAASASRDMPSHRRVASEAQYAEAKRVQDVRATASADALYHFFVASSLPSHTPQGSTNLAPWGMLQQRRVIYHGQLHSIFCRKLSFTSLRRAVELDLDVPMGERPVRMWLRRRGKHSAKEVRGDEDLEPARESPRDYRLEVGSSFPGRVRWL